MLKLVIFDFDGLMVNTEEVVYAAIAELLKTYKVEFLWEHYAKHIGLPVKDALAAYIEDLSLPLSYHQFVSERNVIVERFLEDKLMVMPGLTDILTLLKKRHIHIAIASSGRREYVKKYLKKFHLSAFFDLIVSADDVERGKPHPDLVLRVLDAMRCQNTEAIMLEDAPHGIDAARRANVFTIAVPQPGINSNQYNNANCICKTLKEVYNLFSLLLK